MGRSLFRGPRRSHRRHHQRLQELAGGQGPAQRRVPLGHDVQLHALPRRSWWSTPPSAASSTPCGTSPAKPRGCRSTCCSAASAATKSASTRAPAEPRRRQLAESAKRLVAKYGYTALKMAPHPSGSQSMPYNAVTRAAGERGRGRARGGRSRHRPGLRRARQDLRALSAPSSWPRRSSPAPALPRRAASAWRTWTRWPTCKHKIEIPLATGECLYTKFEFREILAKQAADIIQPDICLAGGILELKKIAAMAEAHYVVVAPHNPHGPARHHGQRALRRLHAQLPHPRVPPRRRVAAQGPDQGIPILVKDGYLPIPDKPGWGYELNEEAFRHYPPKPWHRGFAFGADGAPDFI